MNELTIKKALEKDTFTSKINHQVYARDELPSYVPYPSAFIINTKPRNHPGEHWIAIYFNSKGHATFFDSYKEHPKQYGLEKWLNNNSITWTWNKRRIQGYSQFCGYYALLFLFFIARNKLQNYYKYFTNDFFLNDRKVKKLIEQFN